MKEKFFNTGMEAAGGTPAQLAATVKSEIVRIEKMIKAAGLREK